METLDTRFGVVARLQAKLSRASSTRDDALYDRAIDLALSPTRSDENAAFLYRSVVRDAQRTLSRQHTTDVTDSLGEDDDVLDETEGEYALVDHLLVRGVLRSVRAQDVEAADVLELAIAGNTVAETAAALGLSQRRVRHLRTRLSRLARPLLNPLLTLSE